MTMNPYEILGLNKDCTLEQIKTAYKMEAKKHHPDVGGDPKKFALVKTSYDTLKDRKKRQDYDDYGVIDDAAVQDKDEVAAAKLRQIFLTVLKQGVVEDLGSLDMIAHMRSEILKLMNPLESSLTQARYNKGKTQTALKIVEKRLKRKSQKPNFLLDMLRYGITESDQQIFQINKELKIHEDMLDMLEDFSYDHEPKADHTAEVSNWFVSNGYYCNI